MKRTGWVLLLVFAVLPTAVGCGDQVKVSGKVVFSDDQTPVQSGMISFTSDTFLARGEIRDGAYTLGSVDEGDGVKPGTYNVSFIDVTGSDPKVGVDQGESMPESLIDAKYTSPETSGLTVTIDKAQSDLNFSLDRNPRIKR
jgi:hypothetical protein